MERFKTKAKFHEFLARNYRFRVKSKLGVYKYMNFHAKIEFQYIQKKEAMKRKFIKERISANKKPYKKALPKPSLSLSFFTSFLTSSNFLYSSKTSVCARGSYPFHRSRFPSNPRLNLGKTRSSGAKFVPEYLAPTFLGRSRQSLFLWVKAPQFSQAPFRYLVATLTL